MMTHRWLNRSLADISLSAFDELTRHADEILADDQISIEKHHAIRRVADVGPEATSQSHGVHPLLRALWWTPIHADLIIVSSTPWNELLRNTFAVVDRWLQEAFWPALKKRTSRYQHNVAIPTIASSRCSSFFGRRYAGLYPDLVWFLQRDYYKLHHTCYSPMGQKDGVHAFGYRPNSAESEPIWMKSGAFWAHRWGLAMADFVRGR